MLSALIIPTGFSLIFPMQQTLARHPDSHSFSVRGVEASALRPRPGLLLLRYQVGGKMEGLRLPAPGAPARTDELWRHTCFEVFIQVPANAEYWEFNFAPSRQWAAYHFDGYRTGMRNAEEIRSPGFETQCADEGYTLQVRLELDQWPVAVQATTWSLGLSAVIEETDGQRSYWALAHPPGRADFHHAHSFALQLPVEAQ